jgi:DNA polymerase-3 subunit chi
MMKPPARFGSTTWSAPAWTRRCRNCWRRPCKRGWKAIVRSSAPERIEHLDAWLWSYPRRELPAARAGRRAEPGAPADPARPPAGDNPTPPTRSSWSDGAETGDLTGYQRCIVIFDGADEGQLTNARAQFRDAKARGLPVSYWKQQARGWEKQA